MRLQDPLSRLEGGGRVGAARDLGAMLAAVEKSCRRVVSRNEDNFCRAGHNNQCTLEQQGTLQDSLTRHSLGAIVLYPLLAPLTGAELAILLPSEAALESTQPG